MTQPTTPDPSGTPGNPAEFELLAAPPGSPDLSAELKARKGSGPSTVTLSLIGVVLLVGGFVGGIAVGKHSSSSTTSAAGSPTAQRSRGGFTGGQNGGPSGARGGFGGGVTGTVQKVDGDTITIVDANGKVTTVTTTTQTTVTIGKTATVTDLAPGTQITVIGTTGSDGTVTARSVLSGISLNVLGGARGNRGGATPGAPTSTPNG